MLDAFVIVLSAGAAWWIVSLRDEVKALKKERAALKLAEAAKPEGEGVP